jgi:hypothetical protein
MANYSNIIKNMVDIPNYITNEDLRKFINLGIHDIIRHSNNINYSSSVIFHITINKKEGLYRTVKCAVSFKGATPSKYTYDPIVDENEGNPHNENTKIYYPMVRRTTVESEKQSNTAYINITLEV